MFNGIPKTTRSEELIPGIWARLVLDRSGWTRNRIDSTFFSSSPNTSKAGGARGTSAFLRYLSCASEIRKTYKAKEDPFLQIDSCWPGTFRYLAHPFVDLLKPQNSLPFIHDRMVMADWRYSSLLFAGAGITKRRNYQDPTNEIKALRLMWRDTKNPRHRVHYFPDLLCLVLGWIQEAGLIGDTRRLKLLPEQMPVNKFGLSFKQLNFLERPFAEFLDRWLSLTAENLYEHDAYRLSRMHTASQLVIQNPRMPSDATLLDLEGLASAIFSGEHATELSATEILLRHKIDSETKVKLTHKVSWDRSDLLIKNFLKNK